MLEACHILGIRASAGIAAVRTGINIGSALVGIYLHILPAVINLLALEGKRHAQLGSDMLEVSLGSSIIEVVVNGHGVIGLGIAGSGHSDFAAVDGYVLDGECIRGRHFGSRGEVTGLFLQQEAALVGDFQLIATCCAVLVRIGSGACGHLLDGD